MRDVCSATAADISPATRSPSPSGSRAPFGRGSAAVGQVFLYLRVWDPKGGLPAFLAGDEYRRKMHRTQFPRKTNRTLIVRSRQANTTATPDVRDADAPLVQEKCKTLVAFAFLLTTVIFNLTCIAVIHERVPDRATHPPLPDIYFDVFPPVDWALDVSEYIIIFCMWTTLGLMLVHRYRWIVMQRVFFIMALLYFMRGITMSVTQVPIASTTYFCSPKANSTNLQLIATRVAKLLSGFGLSVNGQHSFCGDYIFSGHTFTLTLAYLVFREYSPQRLKCLHFLYFVLAAVGCVPGAALPWPLHRGRGDCLLRDHKGVLDLPHIGEQRVSQGLPPRTTSSRGRGGSRCSDTSRRTWVACCPASTSGRCLGPGSGSGKLPHPCMPHTLSTQSCQPCRTGRAKDGRPVMAIRSHPSSEATGRNGSVNTTALPHVSPKKDARVLTAASVARISPSPRNLRKAASLLCRAEQSDLQAERQQPPIFGMGAKARAVE
ncbi:hypothetical protein HPB48_001769 [Haemaphysalis longicornis]|uniref:Sphingomyelin synthase-like domain-containing protein n=1 Tax=Haemaphysalis longicornis TaxID=44386 RepID=A0A9J6GD51_HAELO|nr:hypothetical protein HPB48_001769 [Haemaphysalis longicornis]